MKLNMHHLNRPDTDNHWTDDQLDWVDDLIPNKEDSISSPISTPEDDYQTRGTYCAFQKHSTSRLALSLPAIQQQVISQVIREVNALQPLSKLRLVKLVSIGGNHE
jgi:hypothetical protein